VFVVIHLKLVYDPVDDNVTAPLCSTSTSTIILARTAAICRKPGFLDRPRLHATECVLGPCLHAGGDRAPCVGGRSRGNDMGPGGRCLAPWVVCIRWGGPARCRAHVRERCAGGRVGGLSAWCLPAVRGSVRVDAWAGTASGVSFRAVVLVSISGILLLLPWGRVVCGKVPNNAHVQNGQELGASAGGCRARSLASTRFSPLSAQMALRKLR
jgi:hypothetical protein